MDVDWVLLMLFGVIEIIEVNFEDEVIVWFDEVLVVVLLWLFCSEVCVDLFDMLFGLVVVVKGKWLLVLVNVDVVFRVVQIFGV